MTNVFRFLEIRHTDPDRKPTFVSINEFGAIHGIYTRLQAAKGILDHLEV